MSSSHYITNIYIYIYIYIYIEREREREWVARWEIFKERQNKTLFIGQGILTGGSSLTTKCCFKYFYCGICIHSHISLHIFHELKPFCLYWAKEVRGFARHSSFTKRSLYAPKKIFSYTVKVKPLSVSIHLIRIALSAAVHRRVAVS